LWLHSLKVAQLLRSAACLHTNQSRSYLNHLVLYHLIKLLGLLVKLGEKGGICGIVRNGENAEFFGILLKKQPIWRHRQGCEDTIKMYFTEIYFGGCNVHVPCSGYGLLNVGLCDHDIQDFLKLGNFMTRWLLSGKGMLCVRRVICLDQKLTTWDLILCRMELDPDCNS